MLIIWRTPFSCKVIITGTRTEKKLYISSHLEIRPGQFHWSFMHMRSTSDWVLGPLDGVAQLVDRFRPI